ncbi:MAG: amino acid adenylation domain-containing protein [Phycisphaerae bacterium]|nr:amino acid adenylation domain-containing protein [Phycisphaerae bacterium]NIW45394.1 amino acid adenylation domain-containing protein [Gammaproteobacteria bacterium]NIX00602.1 amino acid adenylation domain-containing protein [Phycisphaerae bacterium]NIX30261.1 amino acid adenylation domain-containing protein [Phycisphaerae bacterium]
MQELYQLSLEGCLMEAPEFPRFQDFITYEQAYENSAQYLDDKAYWERKLSQSITPIPFYNNVLIKQTTKIQRGSRHLGYERTKSLKDIAQQEIFAAKTLNVSLFNIFVAIFAAYLYRISGQQYLSIGTPFLNRPSRQFRETIGSFMHIAPLRIAISEDETFTSLTKKIQLESYETRQHQQYTVRNFQNSAYDVEFNYHNTSFSDFHGAPTCKEWVHPGHGEFSLSLHFWHLNPENFLLEFDFHNDIFNQEQQKQTIEHFLRVVDAFLADPDQRLSDIDLLSPAEKQHILGEFNQTQAAFPQDLCIHQLFEAQVERTPEAIAAVFEGRKVTYRNLNAQANQLAHYLKQQGVQPEVLVGVCIERSIEALVALLGVLKAGGAYLPLDPTYPPDRLSFMLEDAQVSILLTKKKFLDLFPNRNVQVVCLDRDWELIAQESDDNLVNETTADNLAYVIYTSGSTGIPKGVLALHRGAVNRFAWMWQQYPFEPGEVCCQKTSLNFVDSVWEIFGPLLQGVPTVIISDEVVKDPSRLIETLSAERVSRIVLVPSLLRVILEGETDLQSRLSKLKYWVSSGEALPLELCQRFQERLPNSILINLYGSSEIAADVTCYDLRLLGTDQLSVPIGRPIANSQVYILDAHLQPVPIGVPGELYVGGVGLARGYLNRPALTAEKFIPHSFSDEPGARLYKTGDLARYLPGGDIEYLGRMDHQVKIRGYRIELGEIEATLRQHSSVRQTIVTAPEGVAGDKRLVAYIVPYENQEPVINELRHFLQTKLPAYMVPPMFVFLESLPLTPNGKVNRQALPAPETVGLTQSATCVAPRNPIEEILVELWCEGLGLGQVGIYEDFFELGVDSLLAASLFHKIERRFDKKLPLATLFEAPTIAQIADILGQDDWSASWSSLVAIQPSGTNPPLFFVHAHGGNVVGYYDLARHLGPDQPFYGVQAQGLDGESAGKQRFEDMAAHYIEEIRTVQPRGPYFLGGWCLGGNVAFEMAQQLQAQGEEVALLAMVQSTHSSYPRYLPNITWFRRLIYRIIERIDLEVSNFLEVETKAKWPYLATRAKRAITIIQAKVEKIIAALLPQFQGHIVHSQAYTLETLKEAHAEAYRNYKAKPYQGYVMLFRAKKQPLGIYPDPKLGWGELIEGGLEIHEAPGYRIGLLSEPRVRIVAEQLRACLEKAQNGQRHEDNSG